MAKLNNSILTYGVSFPYGNRRLGIARIRRLQFIASPTFGYSSGHAQAKRSASSSLFDEVSEERLKFRPVKIDIGPALSWIT